MTALAPTAASGLLRRALAVLRPAVRRAAPPRAADRRRGHVALIGAGPGAADLITLRGLRRLQEADVVLHDRLVDADALAMARAGAELIDVGKAPSYARGGPRGCPQPAIDRLMVALALAGRRVARLKCGDPGVFGRAAEELAALAEAGVPAEIIPGVTAAAAAAAAAGAPLTDRAGARAVTLLSAHPAADAPPVDWAAHAATGAALAVYMGVRRAADVADGLIAGGAGPDWPVEIAERVGAADGRVLRATLATLAAVVAAQGVRNPAMLLIRPPAGAAARRTAAVSAAEA